MGRTLLLVELIFSLEVALLPSQHRLLIFLACFCGGVSFVWHVWVGVLYYVLVFDGYVLIQTG